MLKCAIVFLLLVIPTNAVQAAELIKVKLDDGEVSTGKLHIPVGAGEIKELVIFIHGTGPNTYENPRKFGDVEFKYYDMFGEEFNRHGIAFYLGYAELVREDGRIRRFNTHSSAG